MGKPFYCLFFSFKGGVGRTSALMNTALYLARQKKRVLIIDFDLHAPGVDIFAVANDKLAERLPSYHPGEIYSVLRDKAMRGKSEKKPKPRFDNFSPQDAPMGVVELCLAWQESLESGSESSTPPELPELRYPGEIQEDWESKEERYLYRLPLHNLGDGQILVMRAGNHDGADFAELRRKLDVRKLDPGFEFSRRFLNEEPGVDKEQLMPPFVADLQRQIAESIRPDYVLVDSRPGEDWAASMALTWFSQCTVLAFNLNPWNLEGIIRVYNNLLQTPWHRKTPNILLLATPIPRYAETSTLYEGQYQHIMEVMDKARNSGVGQEGSPIEVPYADILALRDVLITDMAPNDPAVKAYEDLGQLIIKRNTDDLQYQIEQVKQYGDPERVIEAFKSLFREKREEVPLLFEYGKCLYGLGRHRQADREFARIWALFEARKEDSEAILDPYYQDTLVHRGLVRLALAREFLAEERKHFLRNRTGESVDEHLATLKALETELSHFIERAHEQWGEISFFAELYGLLGDLWATRAEMVSLADWAQEKIEGERLACLDKAAKNYELAADRDGSQPHYRHGLGVAKGQMALMSPANESVFEETISAFEDSIRLKPDSPDTHLELGRYRLLQAVRAGKGGRMLPMPMFVPYQPYVQYATDVRDWFRDEEEEIEVDTGALEAAEKCFTAAIQLRTPGFFAYFYRGIARTMLAIIGQKERARSGEDASEEAVCRLINKAIVDFDKAAVNQPAYSPSYFYSGMMQFLLQEVESGGPSHTEEAGVRSHYYIRLRQAFYRLEHFIDREAEKLVESEEADRRDRDDFYFDPVEISMIEDDYRCFLATLEQRMGFPRLLRVLYHDAPPQWNREYVVAIARHLKGKDDASNGS